jgi:hypothetical protein
MATTVSEFQYLRYHPTAPQGPINKTIGICRPQPGKNPANLVAQYQVLPRLDERHIPENRFRQSSIAKRQRKLNEVSKSNAEDGLGSLGTTHVSNDLLPTFQAFAGIARDASVQMASSTAPYITVATRGLTPVAVPKPVQNVIGGYQLWPAGRFGTAVMALTPGVSTIKTIEKTIEAGRYHSRRGITDVVGTVLHHAKDEHPLVHLHPFSGESLDGLQSFWNAGFRTASSRSDGSGTSSGETYSATPVTTPPISDSDLYVLDTTPNPATPDATPSPYDSKQTPNPESGTRQRIRKTANTTLAETQPGDPGFSGKGPDGTFFASGFTKELPDEASEKSSEKPKEKPKGKRKKGSKA